MSDPSHLSLFRELSLSLNRLRERRFRQREVLRNHKQKPSLRAFQIPSALTQGGKLPSRCFGTEIRSESCTRLQSSSQHGNPRLTCHRHPRKSTLQSASCPFLPLETLQLQRGGTRRLEQLLEHRSALCFPNYLTSVFLSKDHSNCRIIVREPSQRTGLS